MSILMQPEQIRKSFLQFFADSGHEVVDSSPLVPEGDQSLLFTNAGMVQFKDVFLGHKNSEFAKAVSCQRCVRAGGKHNDLEHVGFTARHHTFFEMLGNFSFGSYFKEQAIHFAWQYLTEVLCMPPEKLWITVFNQDKESERIWLKDIKVDVNRFVTLGKNNNFWAMGETGPCGPCTEIFYDHGERIAGGPPGSRNEDGDRFTELWNLVFMQYERSRDGCIHELPSPCVDTGMGFERLCAVVSGVSDNYQTAVFIPLLRHCAKILHQDNIQLSSLRVIADHLRSSCFLLIDGVIPSNEGRGYVLRRIIRRATRHADKLGANKPVMHLLVDTLSREMGEHYPQLRTQKAYLEQTLESEELQFRSSLKVGLRILEEKLAKTSEDQLPGALAFLLYDTYGFPMDLTETLAVERRMTVDKEGFERCMEEQRKRSKASQGFADQTIENFAPSNKTHYFSGYDTVQEAAVVLGLYKGKSTVKELHAGDKGGIILERTPFYAESGGQVGDKGSIRSTEGDDFLFVVEETQKLGDYHCHIGHVDKGVLHEGDRVQASIDAQRRDKIVLNHSATHLLHAALRQILGDHVSQKGSLVEANYLRFDFSHGKALSEADLFEIETLVNEQIRANLPIKASIMPKEQALVAGAMALFSEKYDKEVRVLEIGSFSKELCGGTHADRSGDIGCFKIVKESAIASGIRRIEAVTAGECVRHFLQANNILQVISRALKTQPEQLPEKVDTLVKQHGEMRQKQVTAAASRTVQQHCKKLRTQAQSINGVSVVASCIANEKVPILRQISDQMKSELGSSVVMLASNRQGNTDAWHYIAGVTPDVTSSVTARSIVQFLAAKTGGKGGGRPEFAEGGVSKCPKLQAAVTATQAWIKEQLGTLPGLSPRGKRE